jgi:hypothetical protein
VGKIGFHGIAGLAPTTYSAGFLITLLWSEWARQAITSGLPDSRSQIDLDPNREMLKLSIIMTATAVKTVAEKQWA